MLKIAGFDRYDMVNNTMSDRPSFTIWFTGCTHHCYNCHNTELWDKDAGDDYEVWELADMIIAHYMQYGTRDVVLLGGEPLQQDTNDLHDLCLLLYKKGIRVWLYTGYDFDEAKSILSPVFPFLYTIKCGRYIDELRTGDFPASSNQKIFRQDNVGWSEIKL